MWSWLSPAPPRSASGAGSLEHSTPTPLWLLLSAGLVSIKATSSLGACRRWHPALATVPTLQRGKLRRREGHALHHVPPCPVERWTQTSAQLRSTLPPSDWGPLCSMTQQKPVKWTVEGAWPGPSEPATRPGQVWAGGGSLVPQVVWAEASTSLFQAGRGLAWGGPQTLLLIRRGAVGRHGWGDPGQPHTQEQGESWLLSQESGGPDKHPEAAPRSHLLWLPTSPEGPDSL